MLPKGVMLFSLLFVLSCKHSQDSSKVMFSDNDEEQGFIAENMVERSWCYYYPETYRDGMGASFGMAVFDEDNNVTVSHNGQVTKGTWEIPNQQEVQVTWEDGSQALGNFKWIGNADTTRSMKNETVSITQMFNMIDSSKTTNTLDDKAFCMGFVNSNSQRDLGVVRFFSKNKKSMYRLNFFNGELEVGTWKITAQGLVLTAQEKAVGPFPAGSFARTTPVKPQTRTIPLTEFSGKKKVVAMRTAEGHLVNAVLAH